MNNSDSSWVDDLVDDIIALGTDHPNGASPDGKKSDGTYAPQNADQAKQKLLQWRNEARHETAIHIKNICPVTDGASAERLHSRIDTYIKSLESKGE